MANQFIDFKQSGTDLDTGEKDNLSIRPISDNEAVTETITRRPAENLRHRTEIIRDAIDGLEYLSDADRALLIQSAGFVTWDGATTDDTTKGTFVITSDLIIRPYLVTPANTVAKVIHDGVVISTIPNTVGLVNPPRAYSGANKFTVDVTGAAATLGLTVGGTPADNYALTVNNDAVSGSTRQQVVDFLNAQTSFTNAGLVASLDSGAVGTGNWGVGFSSTPTNLKLAGAVDAEQHIVTATGLAAFFTAAGNRMREGDTLCIWYDELVMTGSYGGRRQSLSSSPESSANVDNNLFLLRNQPERQAIAIPICTVANDRLVFVTGERLTTNTAVQLGGTGNKLPFELVFNSNTNEVFRFSATDGLTLKLERKDLVSGVYDGDAVTLDIGDTGKLKIGAKAEFDSDGTQGRITLKKTAESDRVVTKDDLDVVFGSGNADPYHTHTTLSSAIGIANTPAGNIAATNVQAAINELDSEKAGLGLANTFTQNQTINANAFANTFRLNATRTRHVILSGTFTVDANVTLTASGQASCKTGVAGRASMYVYGAPIPVGATITGVSIIGSDSSGHTIKAHFGFIAYSGSLGPWAATASPLYTKNDGAGYVADGENYATTNIAGDLVFTTNWNAIPMNTTLQTMTDDGRLHLLVQFPDTLTAGDVVIDPVVRVTYTLTDL
jgi:hypothetical protein